MLPLLVRRPDVRVTVLADTDKAARARAVSRAVGARVEPSWQAALASADLDAVVVTLPTALHAEVALAAIARGVAMYLEKPLASTLEAATAVRDAARASPLTIAVGFNSRFHPLLVRMRDQLRDSRIGEPRMVRCAFTVAARYEGSWRHHASDGGGVLHDLASHHADLIRYLLGREVLRVSALRAIQPDGSEALAAAGELEGGVLLSATWASGTIDDDVVEVVGTNGALRLSRYESLDLSHRGRSASGLAARVTQALPTPGKAAFSLARRRAPWHDPSFAAALDHFIVAARGRTAAVPGVEEGWHSARVIAAIAEAARSAARVSLDGRGDARVHLSHS